MRKHTRRLATANRAYSPGPAVDAASAAAPDGPPGARPLLL